MRAVIQSGHGRPEEVLSVEEIPVPVPKEGEVLVKVRATSMHADIWHAITGLPYIVRLFGMGLRRPASSVPGTDLAGIVDAVGSNVTRFKPGDEVFGQCHIRMQMKNGGAYAEYAVAPERVLQHKPPNVTFEQAASVPTSGIITWLNLLAFGEISPGQTILVNGAGGGVGTLAVQITKARGATVTAVDNEKKMAMLRELGADHVIDYTRENVMEREERYDFILDVATTLPYPRVRGLLNPTGLYLMVGHSDYGKVGGKVFGRIPGFMKFLFILPFDKHLPKFKFEFPAIEDVSSGLKKLMAEERITPPIDRTYPLDEVANALQYLSEGASKGKIVITP